MARCTSAMVASSTRKREVRGTREICDCAAAAALASSTAVSRRPIVPLMRPLFVPGRAQFLGALEIVKQLRVAVHGEARRVAGAAVVGTVPRLLRHEHDVALRRV